jgi:heme A synthase
MWRPPASTGIFTTPTGNQARHMRFLYHAHSGLRYLVLVAALAAVIALAYALATNRANRATRILPAVFTGLLDLQVLLGIGLVLGGLMPDIVVGHIFMMIPALVVAHGASIFARRAANEQRALRIRLGGIVLALLLIAGGIMALGRSVFGSAPMTRTSDITVDARVRLVRRGDAR